MPAPKEQSVPTLVHLLRALPAPFPIFTPEQGEHVED